MRYRTNEVPINPSWSNVFGVTEQGEGKGLWTVLTKNAASLCFHLNSYAEQQASLSAENARIATELAAYKERELERRADERRERIEQLLPQDWTMDTEVLIRAVTAAIAEEIADWHEEDFQRVLGSLRTEGKP